MPLKLNQWEYIEGSQNGVVTPDDDTLLYSQLLRGSYWFKEPTVTQPAPNQILVSAASGVVQGRMFSIAEETVNITLPDTAQRGMLAVRIDLLATETPITWAQYTSAADPVPTQENLLDGGTVYEVPIASYDVAETGASNVIPYAAGDRLRNYSGIKAGNPGRASIVNGVLNVTSYMALDTLHYSSMFDMPSGYTPSNTMVLDGDTVSLIGLDGNPVTLPATPGAPIELIRRGNVAFAPLAGKVDVGKPIRLISLWSGSPVGVGGNIPVTNASQYNVLAAVVNSAMVTLYRTGSNSYGTTGGIYYLSGAHVTVNFGITRKADNSGFTIVEAGYLVHNPSGVHGATGSSGCTSLHAYVI